MYLGIDVGTSALKAILIDATERVVATRTAPLSVSRPRAGWAEQDPLSWWRACQAVLNQLSTHHRADLASLKGVGLSGQMHGAVLLDETDRVLRAAILGSDGRATAEAAELNEASQRITGNLALPGFSAPKLFWVKRNEPEVFGKIRAVLPAKDYLRLRLTGEKATDMSDAAGTLWLATGERAWSEEMIEASGADERWLPRLAEGSEVVGEIGSRLATRWGLPAGVKVAAGAGDAAAAACAAGVLNAGSGLVSLGAAGTVFVASERFRPNPSGAVNTYCHAVPERWHQIGIATSAMAALEWLSRVLSLPAEHLVEELGPEPAGPSPVRFLPHLLGERTPHNDTTVRAAFTGLSLATARRDLTHAVLEGVAFSLKDCLEQLTVPLAAPRRLVAVGTGARFRYWLQLIATVLDVPIAVPAQSDLGAAFGAARLAMAAATETAPAATCKPPEFHEIIDPVVALRDPYAQAYADYRAVYAAVRPVTQ